MFLKKSQFYYSSIIPLMRDDSISLRRKSCETLSSPASLRGQFYYSSIKTSISLHLTTYTSSFQFYNSSIKTQFDALTSFVYNIFQFYNSSIKSRYLYWEMQPFRCLNSIIVRLSRWCGTTPFHCVGSPARPWAAPPPCGVNSIIVRLKGKKRLDLCLIVVSILL